MRIESNIKGVQDRLSRYQRAIPVAMQRANAAPEWAAEAQELAHKTLTALATPEQKPFIAEFVQTVRHGLWEGGFNLRMRSPFPPATSLAQFQAAGQAVQARDLSQNLFLGEVQNFEEMLLEWVANEKNKDRRDAGKSDAEIAGLISWIMLGQHAPGTKAAAAQAKLTPHIADFIARQNQQNRLDAVTVDRWLRAVLQAWRLLVLTQLPQKFKRELRATRGELLPT